MAQATGRHRTTHKKIFEEPPPKTVEWKAMVALFENLGYTVLAVGGSMYKFRKGNGYSLKEHKPHPQTTVSTKAIKRFRDFLETNGDLP